MEESKNIYFPRPLHKRGRNYLNRRIRRKVPQVYAYLSGNLPSKDRAQQSNGEASDYVTESLFSDTTDLMGTQFV